MSAEVEKNPNSRPASRGERLLNQHQVIDRLGIGRASWWRFVKEGRAPAGVLLGPKTRRWRESEIDGFINSLSK